jgi:hypothetical protein
MRTTLGASSPLGSGLLAVLPGQRAYFAATLADFTLPALDAGLAHPQSFETSASLAAVEAMNAQWFGTPGSP